MRILVNVEHLGPNDGVAVSTFQVCGALAKRGHRIDVVYLNGGVFEAEYRSLARNVVQVAKFHFPMRQPWRALYPLGPAIVAGARFRPDVVYDNLLWTLPWSVGVAKLSHAGLVGHMRGYHPGGPSTQQRFLMNHGVSRYVAVSAYARQQLTEVGVDASKIDIVHNGVDPDAYPMGNADDVASARRALGLGRDSFVLVFLGRIDPNKGIETLLRAVRISQHAPVIELLFLGRPVSDAYLSSLRDASRDLRCHWLPEQRDVLTPLHAADVLVAPSEWPEPFGRIIIEAMATGRPAVASRVGGIPEILRDDFCRFLFERGDSAQLATVLDSLRDWRVREPGLGEACSDHVRLNFNLATTVAEVEKRLFAAAAKRARRRAHTGTPENRDLAPDFSSAP
jgi:glycosyltransferase involved in cell wall biosynthesis